MSDLLTAWLLPPLNVLILLIVGISIRRWRPRAGLLLLITGIILLWVTTAPMVADASLRAVEVDPPPSPLTGTNAGAIVILGGGTYINAPEYGTDTVGPFTLERLRYGARLHRQIGLPLLVIGGPTSGARSSEAEQMREVLQQDFDTPVAWLEPTAMNTLESAINGEKILREQGIRKVILVTDAWHMRRARMAFEHAGLEVVPAPLAFSTGARGNALEALMPTAKAMLITRTAWREVIGLGWYRLRFWFS